MTYAALTNWRYDKNIYHQIQSGPQRTSNDLDLTDTYVLTSSGYVYASGAATNVMFNVDAMLVQILG